MNSVLSIASVTAVLKDLLTNRLIQQSDVSRLGDVSVTAGPPDRVPVGAEERPQVNLFLYRIVPNTAWRKIGTESVRDNGIHEAAPLALDLHYLLSAYGEQDFEAEILLGQAIQALHENPVLTEEVIRSSLSSSNGAGAGSPGARSVLSEASLVAGDRAIEVRPEFLSLDDYSKLWSALQARFRPSVAYKVSTVVIETDQ